jgi:hypothetical protein
LAGAAIGAFAGATCVGLEPGLAIILIVRHRALGEIFALVGVDHDATTRGRQRRK